MAWTPNVRIPNQQSWASPALALYNSLLHMVHLVTAPPTSGTPHLTEEAS
jgi:hypothetical protein